LIELNIGEIDLVAHGITITSDRKEEVNFTDYLYLTHQVLVQRKPENWRRMSWSAIEKELIHDAIELIGDTVSVRQNSSYLQRLQNLSKEIGGEIHIDTLPGHLSTDRIIKMVVDGEIKYTVADDNIASINASYYHILDIDVPISFSQRIAWAVSPKSPELLVAVNSWLEEMKDDVDYYVIYNKYFKNRRNFRQRIQSDFYSLTNNNISRYDELIKNYADSIDWDWRLIASLIYPGIRIRSAGQFLGRCRRPDADNACGS
jgi:membrane-bound lytic murein transglycosylase F